MLDPYREQIAHDLMKNEVDEEVNEDEQLDEKKDNEYGKEYSKMYNERKKFFKKKAKGMTKPIMKEGEEQLDELSKEKVKAYKEKADKQLKDTEAKGWPGKTSRFVSRIKGTTWAEKRLKEEQQLDELSKKVLGKYMKKASKEAVGLAGDITKKGKRDPKTLNKFKNRVTGVHYAKSVVDAPDDED